MDDSESGDSAQAVSGDPCASAVPTEHTDIATTKEPEKQSEADGATQRRQTSEGQPKNFVRRLTLNEWLTFLVGVGSLVVSGLTYRNATDTSDLKNAVAGIAELAKQTKREADTNGDLLNIQSGELGIQGNELIEDRRQSGILANQASATAGMAKNTALANIIQTKSAIDQRSSQLPKIYLGSIKAEGFEGPPDNDGFHPITTGFLFKNAGGRATFTEIDYIFTFRPDIPATLENVEKVTADNVDVTNSLDSGIGNAQPISIKVPMEVMYHYRAKTIKFLFYGRMFYSDIYGKVHMKCFGYDISVDATTGITHKAINQPAYICEN